MNKEDKYDALGMRMKRYEEVANNQMLIPDLPLYARIDGRHFSRLTKNLGYPYPDLPSEKYSTAFSQLMIETTRMLMTEFKADIAETHSDEISLGWRNIKTAPFEGKYFKLVSNIASYAGMAFYKLIANAATYENEAFKSKSRDDIKTLLNETPSFDCRLVQLPDEMELVNCFIWRQNDCIRGTINQYAQCWFSHKELLGKSQSDREEMLDKAGHNVFKNIKDIMYGNWFVKKIIVEEIDPKYKQYHPKEDKLVRSKIICRSDITGKIASLINKTECILYGESPVFDDKDD